MDKMLAAGTGLLALFIGAAALSARLLPINRTFAPTREVFSNPLMGYAPSAGSLSRFPESSLVYIDITWRELEPVEGSFDWEIIEEENHMSQWREEGKHAVLRFVCDIPSDDAHRDIPDWLYEKTGGDGTDYDMSYGRGYSPNYNNEDFILCHERAIEALGAQYGDDTFISYVELGSLGHWGEWHVKYDTGITKIPLTPTRNRYVAPYLEAFSNARILMRRPFHEAAVHGLGVFNDMAGEPKSTDEWMDWIQNGGIYSQTGEPCLEAMPQVWDYAPIGGELTSGIPMEEMMGTNLNRTISLIADSHTTFLGPKIPSMKEEDGQLHGAFELLKHMGYRLRASHMKINPSISGKKLVVSLTWNNDGVAPLYWDWPVFLYVMEPDGTVKDRIPVEIKLSKLTPQMELHSKTTVVLEEPMKKGIILGIGIEDPMTDAPAVYLPMESERMGKISVIYSKRK